MLPPYQCPTCGSKNDRVLFTEDKPLAIWRRRECKDCKARWSTYEVTATTLEDLENRLEGLEIQK